MGNRNDIRFTGDWQNFFDTCDKHDLDFLAAHMKNIPTLLKKSGMKIADFGGNGKYTLPDLRNKFYDAVSHEWEVKYDTMHPNLIYHPVKDFK